MSFDLSTLLPPDVSLRDRRTTTSEASEKTTIKIVAGAIHRAADEAAEVLANPSVGVFARGGLLVRPVQTRSANRTLSEAATRKGDGVRRPDGATVIAPVDETALADVLTRHAHFSKYDRRAEDWVPTDCTSAVAKTILSRRGHGWNIPPLRAVVNAPTLRPDGSVLRLPGYDLASGIMLASREHWPDVPSNPSRDDAAASLRRLLSLIQTFPFVSDADRAACIAMFLTAIIRPSLPTAPAFGITAPTPGTGKSLLADVASILATGLPAPALAAAREEVETEKRLGASLLAGDRLIVVDNISFPLRSDVLCSILTQENVAVRVLGSSSNVRVPTSALVILNGNNLRLVGDLTRRSVRIGLDAGQERPEERRFEGDLRSIAAHRRQSLVRDCLIVLRGYLAAGLPFESTPMGSFEVWSQLVRDALLWLDQPDPLATAEEVREADPEREQLLTVLSALPVDEFTVAGLQAYVTPTGPAHQASKFDPAMAEALASFCTRHDLDSRRFGAFLRQHRDRWLGGMRLVQVRNSTKGSTWKVERQASCPGR